MDNKEDKPEKKRRNPLEKEHFLEGIRQKWSAIFTAIGLLIMVATAYGHLKDPAPFLQFFLSIGVTFVLGASASAVMASWKTSSSAQSQTINATENQTLNENRNENLTEKIEYVERTPRPRDFQDEEIN